MKRASEKQEERLKRKEESKTRMLESFQFYFDLLLYQVVIEISGFLISIRPTGVTTKSGRLTGSVSEAIQAREVLLWDQEGYRQF
jgi:hypothetical protein